MDLGLAGKVAVVAGSSRGIGKGIALELAREGARVAINGRDGDVVAKTLEEIGTACPGAQLLGVTADVATRDGAHELIDRTVAAFGALDILVNNSGGPPVGSFFDLRDDDFVDAFALLFMSVVRMVRKSVPHMTQRGGGRIINIESTAVREPVPMITLTNAIRPAIIGLAKDLSRELGDKNITVNTILVGPVMTDRLRHTVSTRASAKGRTVQEEEAEYLQLVPLGRWGTPADIAGIVTLLASERGAWMTGAVIPVDGGRIRSAI